MKLTILEAQALSKRVYALGEDIEEQKGSVSQDVLTEYVLGLAKLGYSYQLRHLFESFQI